MASPHFASNSSQTIDRSIICKQKSHELFKPFIKRLNFKGPVTFPTIVVLGQKVRSNLVSIVQFFCADSDLASDLPYVANESNGDLFLPLQCPKSPLKNVFLFL